MEAENVDSGYRSRFVCPYYMGIRNRCAAGCLLRKYALVSFTKKVLVGGICVRRVETGLRQHMRMAHLETSVLCTLACVGWVWH